MKTILLVLAALVAIAAAQNCTVTGCDQCTSLLPTSSCFKTDFKRASTGEYCGFCAEDSGNTWFYCGGNSVCTGQLGDGSAVCHDVTVLKIGDPCDPTDPYQVCAEGDYEVACIKNGQGSNVCGGVHVYGPGDDCQTDSNVLADGSGCWAGDCTGGKCPGVGQGESCKDDFCEVGLSCDENEICQTSIAIGSPCQLRSSDNDETGGDSHGCVANADCINGVCVEVYSQPAGSPCGNKTYWNQDVCADGLTCDSESDNEPFNCIAVDEGNPCNVDSDTCGDYHQCECNYQTGTGVCVSDRNRAGDALRKGYACLVNNHCWRSLDYFEEGCVKTDCGSQAQAVISALAHAADDVNNLLGRPNMNSGAAHIVAFGVAMLVAIALAL